MTTTEIRALKAAEFDAVSGGTRIALRLPGKVSVQLNTDTGCWSVWLAGKEVAYGTGPKC